MIVSEIIYGAFRLLGQLRAGQAVSTEAEADALAVLNDLIASWNNERLMVYAIVRSTFSLVPSQASYTIGLTGDFNVERPLKIDAGGLVDISQTPSVEIPLEQLTPQQWADDVEIKALTSTLPERFYYETSFPLGRVYPLPIPTLANQLALYLWQTLFGFASATDTISLPPGYARALRYNLAVELGPQFAGKGNLTDPVVSGAVQSKAILKRTNAPMNQLYCDPGTLEYGGGTFDYRTGM